MNQKLLFKVYGLKRSKGVMRDTGKDYDSTTLYIGVPFDESSGNMRGVTIEAMKYGKSDNYAKFDGIPLPFDAEIELQRANHEPANCERRAAESRFCPGQIIPFRLHVRGRGGLILPSVPHKRKTEMKNWKQKLQYGAAVAATALMAAPVMAADDLDPSALVAGINSSKAIVVAVGTAIFGVIGILVALRYGRKASGG